MNGLLHDLRFSLRSLGRNRGFSILAIVVLAIALGANTLVFSLVNGVLLRPLPFPEQERLVTVSEVVPKGETREIGMAVPNYRDLRRDNTVLKDLALFGGARKTISGSARAEALEGGMVTEGLFRILGVEPLLGRGFGPEDDLPKGNPTAIIGYEVWQGHFGGDSNVVGRTILLDATPTTVIGVMPEGFRFPGRSDLWVPLQGDAAESKRTDHFMEAIGRLKDGVSKEQAQTELAGLMQKVNEENPVTSYGQTVRVGKLREELGSEYRQEVLILLGAVAAVLLIACANLTNLLLVRGTSRKKEIAVRAAIGAPRWRLVRQFMVESLVLVTAGAVAGLLIAVWCKPVLLRLIPVQLPFWMNFELDGRVIAFLIGSSVVAAVLAGVIPAVQESAVDLVTAMKDGTGATATRGRKMVRGALVVSELAISLVLLIGAGLLIRSMQAIVRIDPGFDAKNVLLFSVRLPDSKYKDQERVRFFRGMAAELRSVPGVESVAASSTPPLAGRWGRGLTVEGAELLSSKDAPMVNHSSVLPGYFGTMKINLVEGRDFTEQDTKESRVTIVDRALAEKYWPGQSALGNRVRFGPPEANEPWHTVVGVAEPVRSQELTKTARWDVYLPHAEVPVPSITVLMRTQGDPLSYVGAVRARMEALDADLALSRVRTMETILHEFTWEQRFVAVMLTVFSAIALLLASVGLYGVISYTVRQRSHELGIRLALGARPVDLMRMVMREGIALTLVGVAIGVALALPMTGTMTKLIFGVKPSDPNTLMVVALVMTLVAAVATFVPARRAMRTDPMRSLRYE